MVLLQTRVPSWVRALKDRFFPTEPATVEIAPRDLLRSNIHGVIIEVTSECNLRCTYCAKAHPAYDELPFVNTNLADDTLFALYDFCKAKGIKSVTLSGVGETAMREGWEKRLSRFLDDDEIEVHLVSNLTRSLTPDDLDALCKLKVLQISFDSADPEAVRKMRSKARLSHIVENIERLKLAMVTSRRRPELLVNCTVSRQNIGHIVPLALLCRKLEVDRLLVGEMIDINPDSNLEPLRSLSSQEITALVRDVVESEHILSGSKTSFDIQPRLQLRFGGMLERERSGMPIVAPTEVFHRAPPLSACTQPWETPFVRSDGKVFPCCGYKDHFAPIGDLAMQTLGDIYESKAARDVRESILSGSSTLPCKGCLVASNLSLSEFTNDIAGRLQ